MNRVREHLYTTLQGFAAGAIVMAYITNYNRNQLHIAVLCLLFSIAVRMGEKD